MPRLTLPTLAAVLVLLAPVARAAPADARSAPQDRAGTAIHGLRATHSGAPMDVERSEAPIEVEKIEVVQETPWSLLLDVTYQYRAAAPPDQVKLFVLPDMPYWLTADAKVAKGRNVARIELGLYEKKLKDDGHASYETSTLTVSFRHYAPAGYKGPLLDEIVPFRKTWRPRG